VVERRSPIVVARVVTRLNVGGPTRHVASLMRGLQKERFAQTLFVGKAEASEGEGVLSVDGAVVSVPELRRAPRPFSDLAAYRRLVAAFRGLRPDVVHTHQGKAGALGRFAARAAGVPIVVHTHHGLTFEGYFGPIGRALYRAFESAAARRSDALIAQSECQKEALCARLPADVRGRVVVVPPGVDVRAFLRPRATPRRNGEARSIVVPARLTPIKDPGLALDVMKLLPKRFTATFFGDGPTAAAVRARIDADPDLRDRVRTTQPIADVAEAYARADVVLLTSVSEGTPLSLIEAQLAGTPVVAPDVGGTRSVVHEEGGTTTRRDAASLAAAVATWSERSVSEKAKRELAARFSDERLCADVAALYERLLSSRSPTAGRP
jgi:glycosyltransferase involved in cell wall biosynthesis